MSGFHDDIAVSFDEPGEIVGDRRVVDDRGKDTDVRAIRGGKDDTPQILVVWLVTICRRYLVPINSDKTPRIGGPIALDQTLRRVNM